MSEQINIVLVEDLETDAELVLREMKRAGMKVSATRVDTEAAVRETLAAATPDLILSDFSMPQFDGLTALAVCRKLCPEVPFIFVSGTLGEDNAIRALKAGATDYVLKTNLVRLPSAADRAVRDARARALARRREAEDKRLKSLIAGIVDLMSTPFVVTDMEAIVQIINPAFTKVFGWTFADLVGKDVRELVPDENESMFREYVRLDTPGRLSAYESYVRKKNGDLVAARFSARTIQVDGQPSARIAFVDHVDLPADPGDARPPVSKSKFEQGAAALAERAAKLKGIVAGRISLTGLSAVETKCQGDWPAKKRRVMDAALAIIGRNLGPRDLMTEEDDGFLLALYDVTEPEAELTCRAIESRVNEFLFGEFDIKPGDLPKPQAPPIRVATISAEDVAKFGSFGSAIEGKLGASLGLPSLRPSLEADIQRRRDRLIADVSEMIGTAKVSMYEIGGPKGPAPDVDFLDFDPRSLEFIRSNLEAIEAQEGLKVELNLARIERIISGVIAGEFGSPKKRHLIYLTIEVLRDQASRRQFLSLWRLVPTDLQKNIILCFQDVDRGLAPVAVESAILQIAGLVFATGIVLIQPSVPNLNLQLIKNRVVVLDMLPGLSIGSFSDNQWSAAVRSLRQKGCKVFVRGGDQGRALAARIGADGAISQ